MKYINSIFATDQSGRLGGVVFSYNKYGTYQKMLTIPTDPQTQAQMDVRSRTGSCAKTWKMLTYQQRIIWNQRTQDYIFEKKTRRYNLSGFMFFMKLNRNLQEVAMPVMRDFPEENVINNTSDPQDIKPIGQIINMPTGLDLILNLYPGIDVYTRLQLSATLTVLDTESFKTTKPRKIGILDSSFLSGSSIKDIYIKRFQHLPTSGFKIFLTIKSVNINTGFSTIHKPIEVFGI